MAIIWFVFISSVLNATEPKSQQGYVGVSSVYTDLATEKKELTEGVGFTVLDSNSNRLFLVTCAHLVGGGNVSLGGIASLGRLTNSLEDVAVYEIQAPASDFNPTFIRNSNREMIFAHSFFEGPTQRASFADRFILFPRFKSRSIDEYRENLIVDSAAAPSPALNLLLGDFANGGMLYQARPGDSGSPIVTRYSGNAEFKLFGMTQSYSRFFDQMQSLSSSKLNEFLDDFLKGKRDEQSRSNWALFNRNTFRITSEDRGVFWEISPNHKVAGGLSADGGTLGDRASASSLSQFALYTSTGRKSEDERVIAFVDNCQKEINRDCFLFPHQSKIQVFVLDPEKRFKIFSSGDLKQMSLAKHVGLVPSKGSPPSTKVEFSGSSAIANISVRPGKANSLFVEVTFDTNGSENFTFEITPKNFQAVFAIQNKAKPGVTYFVDLEDFLYFVPEYHAEKSLNHHFAPGSRYVRIRRVDGARAGPNWLTWIQLFRRQESVF